VLSTVQPASTATATALPATDWVLPPPQPLSRLPNNTGHLFYFMKKPDICSIFHLLHGEGWGPGSHIPIGGDKIHPAVTKKGR
jgi:hypothetical protein